MNTCYAESLNTNNKGLNSKAAYEQSVDTTFLKLGHYYDIQTLFKTQTSKPWTSLHRK